ncbi:lactoylglutathione lyase [Fulvimarina pelagi HTCC2506]|uniref:Lactoylglutathione lyase n=1 Tax=Fulvimarina pelagi HTCC2506 TaxID=314231 RepID=Q0G2M6_9HYPH|nr:lactoylglutathione lyase [Fulvimarina pelagi HTCC2506]
MQQLERNSVGGLDEGHMPVARRPIDDDAVVHQFLTGAVDIIDRKSEMAEIASAGVFFRVPVVGELHQRSLGVFRLRQVVGGGEEYEREAALFTLFAIGLHQAELVAVKVERGIKIADADHRMQIAHCDSFEIALCLR